MALWQAHGQGLGPPCTTTKSPFAPSHRQGCSRGCCGPHGRGTWAAWSGPEAAAVEEAPGEESGVGWGVTPGFPQESLGGHGGCLNIRQGFAQFYIAVLCCLTLSVYEPSCSSVPSPSAPGKLGFLGT